MGRHASAWDLDVTGVDRQTGRGRIVGVTLRHADGTDTADWLPVGATMLVPDGAGWTADLSGIAGEFPLCGTLWSGRSAARGLVTEDRAEVTFTAGITYLLDYDGQTCSLTAVSQPGVAA
ncbi:hypothetical protein AB0M43_37205 [Longispora sp. NPDC051575]|uniref:hypothetical protein n=1 Tax=Longispora sp. NPDC051575 TaxID=3154943 RepID=UPI003442EFB8